MASTGLRTRTRFGVLTLNYKGLPYRVKYLKIEEVEPTMKAMGIPPTSTTKFPYYTLPMIADPSANPNEKPTYVSDSFQIAAYLDEKYPSPAYPAVLPTETRTFQRIFAEAYFLSAFGAMFPAIAPRVPGILDEASQEYMYRSRGGKDKFAPLSATDEAHQFSLAREKWGELAQMVDLGGGGPWIMGEKPTFADFVVGCAFSLWHKVDSDGAIWKEVATWQDGRWDKYWNRIQAIENKSTAVA
ncbi:hypothetical protein FRC12_021636 [Ceratobasidium sp. 428]|nr:hypothetical protein FRC12_021636 [Ceratobasidium sp. 428]